MDSKTYEEIAEGLHSIEDVRMAALTSGVEFSTALSIFAQKYTRILATCRPNNRQNARRYDSGENIVSVAESQGTSPYLLARFLVTRYLSAANPKGNGVNSKVLKKDVTACARNPARIKNVRLAKELSLAVELDLHCSPYFDNIRRFIGQEYEHILLEYLHISGIPYLSEDDMKSKGFDKTPDVRLLVPISVGKHVISWIDSKASFGDQENHERDCKQMQQYVDRYGPGMVIYWFGFIKDLRSPRKVLVMDHFPQNVETLYTKFDARDASRRVSGGIFTEDCPEMPLKLVAEEFEKVTT
ncbi:hypothetical protein AAMO2058_001404400 [Amorphochlora amoebiformis]